MPTDAPLLRVAVEIAEHPGVMVQMAIAAFGLAYIVGHSGITLPIRDAISNIGEPGTIQRAIPRTFLALIECPACFSTWIGVAFGAVLGRVVQLAPLELVAACAFFGCYLAGTSFILGKLTRIID